MKSNRSATRRPLRVLHVIPYFAPAYRYGGPPRSVLGLCQGLQAWGVELEVLTTSANGEEVLPNSLTHSGTFEGVSVRYFPLSFPKRLFGTTGMRDAVRETLPKVDLVHLHGLWNYPVWMAALESMRFGIPFFISPRGMLDAGSLAHHRWRKELCYKVWERWYLQRATLLHATSEREAVSLAELALGPEVACVPNGVWLPGKAPGFAFREKLGLDKESPVVLYLGRLHPSKRLDLLVESVALARRQNPTIQVIIAGARDGMIVEPLLDRARGWCHWIGEADDAAKWAVLAAARVLVMCSDSESFGMSVLEALAAGIPVVVTKTCPWEIVERVRCGFWVEQRADEISKAILEVVQHPSEARAMGERGRKLAEDRYSWRVIGQEMARHYERALGVEK